MIQLEGNKLKWIELNWIQFIPSSLILNSDQSDSFLQQISSRAMTLNQALHFSTMYYSSSISSCNSNELLDQRKTSQSSMRIKVTTCYFLCRKKGCLCSNLYFLSKHADLFPAAGRRVPNSARSHQNSESGRRGSLRVQTDAKCCLHGWQTLPWWSTDASWWELEEIGRGTER